MDSGRLRPTRTDLLLIKRGAYTRKRCSPGRNERYIYDGGLRRGKLEKVICHHLAAMQQIYNDTKGRHLAKGTPELNAMFDKWYDWSRAERKPITLKTDIEALKRLQGWQGGHSAHASYRRRESTRRGCARLKGRQSLLDAGQERG